MVISPSRGVRTIAGRIFRIVIKIIVVFLLLIVIVLFLLQTSFVQQFGRKKIQSYLQSKLHTRVEIGDLDINFPKKIILRNIYLEDQHRDTLLAGGTLELDVNLWKLFQHTIYVKLIRLDRFTVKVNRVLPDSSFNFDFIAKAFAGNDTAKDESSTKASPWKFELGTIHLVKIAASYKDDATGNDAYAFIGDFVTQVKTFDLNHFIFYVPDIHLTGLTTRIRQYQPMLFFKKLADTVEARKSKGQPVSLQLGTIELKSVTADYSNDVDRMRASLNLGLFSSDIRSIDLIRMQFRLGTLRLQNTVANFERGKKRGLVVKEKKSEGPKTPGAPWQVDLDKFDLANIAFQYDDASKKPLKGGVDYSHLHIQNLIVAANRLKMGSNGYKGQIANISFSEKSGFVVKKLSAGISYSDKEAKLDRLVIQTNSSLIKNQTLAQYASLASLSKKPGDLYADLSFDHSVISVKDVLLFIPTLTGQLKSKENSTVRINGSVKGQLKNLIIPDLELSGLTNTMLRVSGKIKGLPNAKNAVYDIQLKQLTTSKSDLFAIVPAKSIPDNIRLPENISATGSFNGTIDRFKVKLIAVTNKGKAGVDGMLDIKQKSYDLAAHLNAFDLGWLLKQDSILGRVTLEVSAKGNGFEVKTMNTDFRAHLEEGMIKGYDYRNLQATGSLHQGMMNLQASILDPALRFRLNANGNVSAKYPAIKARLQLDTADLLALHLLKDTLGLKFDLNADFSNTDPDALTGKLTISGLVGKYKQYYLNTDTIALTATHTDSAESIHLRSELAEMDLEGIYKLTELAPSILQTIDKYYKLPGLVHQNLESERWEFSALLKPSPAVLTLIPDLKGTDTIRINMGFNSKAHDLSARIEAPVLHYNQQTIRQLNVQATTKDSALHYAVNVDYAEQPGFSLYKSTLAGMLINNQLLTSIILRDQKNKARYYLETKLSESGNGWKLSLKPDSLLLNYEQWTIAPENFIRYDSGGLLVNNFKLARQNEGLLINSTGTSGNAPLNISFKDFRIKTITGFTEQDSLLLDGAVSGKVEIRDLMKNPVFTSDLNIQNLAYKKDTIGNLIVKIDNKQTNAFNANISVMGHGNDVKMDGIYYTGDSKMNIKIVVGQLNLALVKSFAGNQVKDIQGYLKGNIEATGNLTQPILKGSVHFDSTYITPTITGERLRLSSDPIDFDEDGFNFSQFTMTDSAGHKATLDGNVFTKDFKKYRFDLSFAADDFQLVNAPRSPNSLFYGRLNMDANIDVLGDMESPKINADLLVNKSTDFTVILPSDDPEVEQRQGVVVFLDRQHPRDTVRLRTLLDSLSRNAELKGMDVAATIETDSSAQFTMIIDERNGDALALRGRADLSAGIDRSGKLTLTGNYELDNGSYSLSLSVLKRKFIIQRGSTITWTGDPRTADIDITGIYQVNAPSIDLVQQQIAGRSANEINRFKEKLPFMVNLKMKGELLKPVISFDITLPVDKLSLWPEVDNKLQQIRTDQSEINKQVFALLLLNRFVSENPFVSATGGTDAQTLAKQSASKILSDQINQLAASLIKGVDLTVDLNSDKDYTSGQAINQTQLNVGVSKSLFSDRVRVSVGSNFQLEQINPNQSASNIAGDMAVDYKLSRDGRYMLRAYRKDQYESVVEGQVVETGLSFILTFDYNAFFELFHHKTSEHKVKKNKTIKPDKTKNPVN
jgi:hypothetical protein